MSTSPKVWSTFTGKNGAQLSILDAPEDRVQEALDLHIKYYLPEDTLSKAAGISKNEEAIAEYRTMILKDIEGLNKVRVIVCGVANKQGTGIGDIVGVSFSYLIETDKPYEIPDPPKTKELQKHNELSEDMHYPKCLADMKLNKYYDSFGIAVHPDYKDSGIELELLKASRLLCKEEDVSITATWMTSLALQDFGQRAGFETYYEQNTEEFAKKYGVIVENVPSFKFMLAKPL